MITGILSGAPIWVWPLLVLLVVLGVRASRPRQTSVLLIFFLPLLGLITIRSVGALPHPSFAWIGFGVGYLAGLILGYALQGKWIVGRQGMNISLGGEWFTMLTMMLIFWMNFAGGVTKAIGPDLYASVGFSVAFALVVGWASGSFLGIALRVMRA